MIVSQIGQGDGFAVPFTYNQLLWSIEIGSLVLRKDEP